MVLRFFIIGETTVLVWGMTCANTPQLCIKKWKEREREEKEKKKKERKIVPVKCVQDIIII